MNDKAEIEECVTVKVTKLGKKMWGVRIWLYDRLWSQTVVKDKRDIHKAIAAELRMIDKCGNPSKMASASRDRATAIWDQAKKKNGEKQ